MDNKSLQSKYDSMHATGSTSWFSDGREERELILKMGEPWADLFVYEIGCGEGDLTIEIGRKIGPHGSVLGVDYSKDAIGKANAKITKDWPEYMLENTGFECCHYRELYLGQGLPGKDRLVMQGVLEHLDDPFAELQWMIEHFKPKTVITSSPCFLNPRGIVWMTLDMLGAVMSKTDLHFLHPWDFEEFCEDRGYKLDYQSCDVNWGWDWDMHEDFIKRIPLALKDGKIPFENDRLEPFFRWLLNCTANMRPSRYDGVTDNGATMVYRIDV